MNIEVDLEPKKGKKPAGPPLVYLEWEDAVSEATWVNDEGLINWLEEAEQIVRQVGWIVRETKTYIGLVSRRCTTGPNSQDYGMLQKIPKTWIRCRIDLTKHVK